MAAQTNQEAGPEDVKEDESCSKKDLLMLQSNINLLMQQQNEFFKDDACMKPITSLIAKFTELDTFARKEIADINTRMVVSEERIGRVEAKLDNKKLVSLNQFSVLWKARPRMLRIGYTNKKRVT